MALFKCKMCGGSLEIIEGQSIAVCEYCGSKQTVPSADSEKKMSLFTRANRLRFINEFDKAAAIYEQIVSEFPEESEAYWGLFLCKYGIEYVDDPGTGNKIPTCHRSSFESATEDPDFELACDNADAVARRQYREEAKVIEALRSRIIEVSSKEEPYDIFISYKDTDDSGERTMDSVLAQDIYKELTNNGYRVFFSRITLEGKLGTEYEPYIFAALNSAQIMLVVGTDVDNLNAVWVKNEWSRFLALIKAGQKKVLIPCFKDMDAYDMPKELQKLASQNMGKVGAMQDLLHGVEKIISKGGKAEQTAVPAASAAPAAPGVESYLKRVFMYLDDGDFKSANDYCERVLDIDPENGRAYLGKLMAELECRREDELKDELEPFDDNTNFNRAVRFGNDALKKKLKATNEVIKQCSLQAAYNKALSMMSSAATESAYREAAAAFIEISGFKDADEKGNECLGRADNIRLKNESILTLYLYLSKSTEELTLTMPSEFKNLDLDRISVHELEIQKSQLEASLEKLRQEFSTLGTFAFKREKELSSEIGAVMRKISNIEKLIPLKNKYQCLIERRARIKQAADNLKRLSQGIIDANNINKQMAITAAKELYPSKRLKISDIQDVDLVRFLVDNCNIKIIFGKFPTAANEGIEWQVLDKQNGKALLISKYALDCGWYNTSKAEVTWETCSLRSWLNRSFIYSAFTTEEQKLIAATRVTADKNPQYDTNQGNDTVDKIFLLSINEAKKYFSSDSARQAAPTIFAVAQGAWTSNRLKTARGEATCWWWL